MSSRDTAEFLALAAIWGASFLFMRLVAPAFGPVPLMLVRCAVGALTLLPVLLWYGRGGALLGNAGRLLVVGVLNSALPFVLLGYAALSLTAGVTSILNSLAPLWAALVARLWFGDRLTWAQNIGLVLGAVGVSVLVAAGSGIESAGGSGIDPETGSGAGPGAGPEADAGIGALGNALLPFLAGIAATFCYGLGGNFARRFLSDVHPLVIATGSQLSATLALLVPGLLLWPGASAGAPVPSADDWLAALALGVVCTGVAYLLFFRLIASVGPTRTIAVTFVIPVFGVGWGALFLGERIELPTLLGALVIVLGTALTTGVLGARRRDSGQGTGRDSGRK